MDPLGFREVRDRCTRVAFWFYVCPDRLLVLVEDVPALRVGPLALRHPYGHRRQVPVVEIQCRLATAATM